MIEFVSHNMAPLMFAALIPPLWQRVGMPPLTYWKSQPTTPLSSGRRLACVALYK